MFRCSLARLAHNGLASHPRHRALPDVTRQDGQFDRRTYRRLEHAIDVARNASHTITASTA